MHEHVHGFVNPVVENIPVNRQRGSRTFEDWDSNSHKTMAKTIGTMLRVARDFAALKEDAGGVEMDAVFKVSRIT